MFLAVVVLALLSIFLNVCAIVFIAFSLLFAVRVAGRLSMSREEEYKNEKNK